MLKQFRRRVMKRLATVYKNSGVSRPKGGRSVREWLEQYPLATAVGALAAILAPLGAVGAYRLFGRPFSPVREVTISTPVHDEQPVKVPFEVRWKHPDLQLPVHGCGPLYHRVYSVDVAHPNRSGKELMRLMQRRIALFAPESKMVFTKTEGQDQRMQVGDRFDIDIAGPWNGGVAVVEVGPEVFSLVTLKGHPEAGQIRFRFSAHPSVRGALRFEILSWARSRDNIVGIAYEAAGGIGKTVQKNAWIEFCLNVVKASGGEQIGEINVLTEECEFTEEVVQCD